MPTKISLTLGPRQPLSRQVAWGCFTTNLTMPGFGSLLAGRVTGYAQVLILLAGFALTLIYGVHFIVWYFSNSAHLQQLQDEPERFYLELWLQIRWALFGMGLFAVAWVWALISSLGILSQARTAERRNQLFGPPKLSQPPRIQR